MENGKRGGKKEREEMKEKRQRRSMKLGGQIKLEEGNWREKERRKSR